MFKNFYTILIALLFTSNAFAQIDGDNIFQNAQVISIELTFHQTGYWDSLVANYATATYMKADLVLTDETGTSSFTDVGVRLKGNSSYNHPNDKKSFKIDFNEYVSGQKYDGLKKLNFGNCFKDPSMMRDKVFFDVSEAGNAKCGINDAAHMPSEYIAVADQWETHEHTKPQTLQRHMHNESPFDPTTFADVGCKICVLVIGQPRMWNVMKGPPWM